MRVIMSARAALLCAVLASIAAGSMNASQAVASTAAVSAQRETKPAVFDVVAIRPSDPNVRGDCYMKGQPGGQTFVGRCFPLRQLIKYAYKIIDSQIIGAPGWIDTDSYDFEAKTDRPVTRAEVAALFQGLLADRFKLQFHNETRTLSALVLTVDKAGSKMTANDSSYEWDIPIMPIPGSIPKFKGTRCPMYYLTWWIAQRESRPVVDKTGLPGFWDFTLEFIPEGMGRGNGDLTTPVDGSSLTTALRQQLGLKLASEKAPVEVYLIDHVERASAN
jgi:uncharacterized protein (TIGR03435 family)